MAKKRGISRILISTVLSFTILIIGIVFCYKAIVSSYNYTFNIIESEAIRESSKDVSKMTLTITESTNLDEIAKMLYVQGFISDMKYFKLEAKLYHATSGYIPGKYDISSNMSSTEILKRLTTSIKNEEETIKFTIPEGYTINQIAQTLEDKNIVTKEAFLDAVTNKSYDAEYSFLRDIPTNGNYQYKLEGYLFPDTYIVRKSVTAEEIIIMMLNRFEDITSKYAAYLNNSSYSLHEIITIASIIEQEAKLREERPIISGVIYNRLRDHMRLQMCSSVQYSLNKRKANLTTDDLAKDTPYNTYLYEGLPVGPICMPGEDCIRAAFSPEEHDYYYFVVDDEEKGTHFFSSTLDEHAAAKSRYKQNNDINFTE